MGGLLTNRGPPTVQRMALRCAPMGSLLQCTAPPHPPHTHLHYFGRHLPLAPWLQQAHDGGVVRQAQHCMKREMKEEGYTGCDDVRG